MQQRLWFLIFMVGCATKPLEEGTVDADPVVTDPLDNVDADGSGTTTGSDDGGGTTGPVEDTGDEGGSDDDGDETGGGIDCDEEIEMNLFDAPDGTTECVVQPRLECDEELPILATNKRGLSQFDSSEYTSWYCFPFEEDPYNGPEAVFAFAHPGTGTVYIDLHTPCAELSLMAVRWNDWEEDRVCPTEDTVSLQCDAEYETGDERLRIDEFAPINYLLIVDGPQGEQANFTLGAECP